MSYHNYYGYYSSLQIYMTCMSNNQNINNVIKTCDITEKNVVIMEFIDIYNELKYTIRYLLFVFYFHMTLLKNG